MRIPIRATLALCAALPDPPPVESDGKGCGCRTANPGGGLTGAAVLALLVLLWWVCQRR